MASPALDPRIAGYLERNREWAGRKEYKSPIRFEEMQKKGRERVDGTVIVLACTDPRVTPEEFLGMGEGNKATVIRTAGGRVRSTMNTLLVLSAVGNAGKKGTIMVVHHTDCGLQSINDEEIKEVLQKSVETEVDGKVVGEMKFGSFDNPEESVKEDVKMLRDSPFFKGMQIVGYVQDTETGLLRGVV